MEAVLIKVFGQANPVVKGGLFLRRMSPKALELSVRRRGESMLLFSS